MGVAIISRSCSGGLEPEGYTSQVTPGFPDPAGRPERTRTDEVTPRPSTVREARYQPEDLRRMAEENH